MISRSYLGPILLAFVLHAIVIFLLAEQWFEPSAEHRPVPRHINARMVDLNEFLGTQSSKPPVKEVKPRTVEDSRKKEQAELQRQEQLVAKKLAAEQAKRQKAESDRKQKIQQEQARVEAEKKAAIKKAADEKRATELAKQKAEAKLAAEKRAAEQKKKEQIARQQAEEARRVKAEKEATAKRQAEAVAKKEAAERAVREANLLAAQMAAEEAALQAESDRQTAAQYEGYIRQLISDNWRRSANARNGMEVAISIRLLPTGKVDDAIVTRSSGNDRFDREAVQAIFRTDKFPELQQLEPIVFDKFYRQFTLIFRPEDLRW